VPTEADANAEEHADNRTEGVGSQQLREHHLCRLYCLSEAVGWSLHGATIVLAETRKSSFARRRLTPGEASPSKIGAARAADWLRYLLQHPRQRDRERLAQANV